MIESGPAALLRVEICQKFDYSISPLGSIQISGVGGHKDCKFFDEVVINSSLAKSWHDLCMEESTCHEMIIDLLKRFSCMKCFNFLHFSISFKYDFHVDAERIIVKCQQISASMVLKNLFYGAKILPLGKSSSLQYVYYRFRSSEQFIHESFSTVYNRKVDYIGSNINCTRKSRSGVGLMQYIEFLCLVEMHIQPGGT